MADAAHDFLAARFPGSILHHAARGFQDFHPKRLHGWASWWVIHIYSKFLIPAKWRFSFLAIGPFINRFKEDFRQMYKVS